MLTITEHDGIIYKSTRYGNKTKAKIVRREPWKLNINLEKSECAGRAFYNARPSQITSFFKYKSQIGSSIDWQREIAQIRGNTRKANEIILRYIERAFTKCWRRRWRFIAVRKLYWRVWSWLRTNAGGMPNTCKSNGESSTPSISSADAQRWKLRSNFHYA